MKTVLSGIQPTADSLHIGNYLGAVKNWVSLQNDYKTIFFVANLHSLTVDFEPELLKQRTYKTVAQLIACGINPQKSILFIQSDVRYHTMLTWLLLSQTGFGELKRMVQFKDKSTNTLHKESISAGLYIYPVLQAADILLYNTDKVPVGKDQKQHLELSITIAKRINNKFNREIVKLPNVLISNFAKIRDLQNPNNKMSKSSDSENGVINILDTDKQIEKKVKSAMTDSKNKINYDINTQAGISNLIDIYSGFTLKTPSEIVDLYKNKMYGHLKIDLTEILIENIRPIREKTFEILNDKTYLNKVLLDGAKNASEIASETYKKIKNEFGV